MGESKRYLTKSRFKVGSDCLTKLYYLENSSYANNKTDNAFLMALAEGGFQVGELAKLYYPGGTEISTTNKDTAVEETSKLLAQNTATIYEGAFRFEGLFIRADIVIKKGASIHLIEVKAKSFNPHDEDPFYNKNSLKSGDPKINSEWEPYLLDVAFQAFVLSKAYPQFKITSSLMLADKSASASIDGINQKFHLEKLEGGRVKAITAKGTTMEALGTKLLVTVCVDHEVNLIHTASYASGKTFSEMVAEMSVICAEHKFVEPEVGAHCKSCEFRTPSMPDKTLKSGFENCWMKAKKITEEEAKQPFVFDIWNFRKAQKLISEGKFWITDVELEDISPVPSKERSGLSNTERQWIQVEKAQAPQSGEYFDAAGLANEFRSFNFPLHFIDFETTTVAIPFHKGRRPYEQIAFQFSHHIVQHDGSVKHATQYINSKRGAFPNFDFVRALKACLSNDNGTIFRYAAHENTVLCQIRSQLQLVNDVKDSKELIAFVESITTSGTNSTDKWDGPRSMIDLCELVKRFCYYPATSGSNSIKKVLPAILRSSKFLQTLYGTPCYGTDKFPSHNLKSWTWISTGDDGQIIDPYKLLPPVFSDLDLETMDSLITDGSIADGGAAMTAYARMQFTQMSEEEVESVTKALLRYCELDTLAMVMIYQHWRNEISHHLERAA